MDTSLFFLGIVCFLFLVQTQPCPLSCRCVIHSARPSADCSYRELKSVPSGFPSNLTQLSLSVNYISALNNNSFNNILGITSLWLAYNQITSIGQGTFSCLAKLVSVDISHNKLLEFPWSDLSTLSNIQVLSLNNNQLRSLPQNAFKKSKALRSLQLSSNNLSVIMEGTFDSVTSLSHLQLHSNPFNCTCSLMWIKGWLEKAQVTVDRRKDIACLYPKEIKGVPLNHIPDLHCRAPLYLQGDDPFVGKDLLICQKSDIHNLMIQMDTQKSKIIREGEVSGTVFSNRSTLMTPIKQSVIYLCRVFNHTMGAKGEMSISLANSEERGWLQKQKEKLLLVLVSERHGSEVNTVSPNFSGHMLCWLTQLVVWWWLHLGH
ncbi:immunoglobulin superfamily containing leucine-rich repeat protein-like [Discoglossus pictus]